MHFFWADSPMSWLRYMTLKTFRDFNPDVPMVLHTTPLTMRATWATSEDDENYTGQDWRPEIEALGVTSVPYTPPQPLPPQMACDLCRWDVLAAGGMFADMDIIWTRPLPEIEGDGVSCENGMLRMGLISGQAGGFFTRVRDLAHQRINLDAYQSVGTAVMYEIAFGHSLNRFKEARGRDTIAALGLQNIPMEYVHPLTQYEMEDGACPSEAYGLHWYGGLAYSAEVSRTMTPENWGTFSGAIPSALRLAEERMR